MSTFEREIANVSVGYFSRIRKNPTVFPSADVLYNISVHFNWSIEFLISNDIRIVGENMKMLMDFLRKVRQDTINGKIKWEFFQSDRNGALPSDLADVSFFPAGKPLKASYNNNQVVLLAPVYYQDDKKRELHGVSMYIDKSDNIHASRFSKCVCSTLTSPAFIIPEIKELFNIVQQQSQDIRMNPETKRAIAEVMKL